MRSDLSNITLVIDRSGSMQSIRNDAEGGVNAFIQNQAKEPGEALLTLVQFDTEYEFVHSGCPIGKVPPYKLEPRGGTALLDAVGRAINETAARLEKMPEDQRPGLVVFVVMTDGEENSSKEYKKAQIKEMITRQQDEFHWHFNFLAANQDAFAEGGELGIQHGGNANWTAANTFATHMAMSDKVSRMRAQSRTGEEVSNEFTDEERGKMI